MNLQIDIDSERLERELAELASFSDTPFPSATRVVFSEVDLQARAWLKSLLHEAGLTIREDAAGNTFGRWEGVASAGCIATGSHIDALPNAGRFDGTVGVVGALEAIRALQRAGFQPRRSIELVMFTSEEPTLFGIGCLGSRLLSGSLDPDAADRLTDHEGETLPAVRAKAGFRGALETVTLPPAFYDAFIELHIEQGPILEQTATAIGIVQNIAAPASLRISIKGEGGHAGAVLMPQRHDAFLGACEIALGVEAAAQATGAIDTVATTGLCRIFPGAVNSIPSAVTLEIDVRDVDAARRDGVLRAIETCCDLVARKRGLQIDSTVLNADPPAQCDPRIIAALENASEARKLSFCRMTSRAYHDSLFMARIAPMAMVFIPCRAGLSHRPDEFASASDIANGVAVLAGALADLASQ